MDLEIIKIAGDTNNNKDIKNHTHHSKLKNHLCGDEIQIKLIVKKNRIVEFGYEGKSCVYCLAAASLLSKVSIDKEVMKINELCDDSEAYFDDNGKLIQVEPGQPGLLLAEIDDRFRFDGYTDKAATDTKVLRDVLQTGDAWFNTGDLITEIDVGFAMGKPHYQFVDRIGDTFRWRSENVSTNEVGEIINANEQVEIANVYGVDVPAAEGKAGMVSLALKDGVSFDSADFSKFVCDKLPHFAQPVFVRIQADLDTTGTFKLVKGELRKQAYNLTEVGDDAIYVMLPKTNEYKLLDQSTYETIKSGAAGF